MNSGSTRAIEEPVFGRRAIGVIPVVLRQKTQLSEASLRQCRQADRRSFAMSASLTIEDIEDALRRVLDTHNRSPWLDTAAAAVYLSSTPGTLKVWRSLGAGPRYHTVGNKLVRYHVNDLDAFIRGEADR
jgi:hypothetical protein